MAFLLIGAVLSACASRRIAWSWRSPVVWLTGSLLWQALGLACWTLAPEPGFLLWSERLAALLTAMGLASWCQSQSPLALVRSLMGAGAGVLLLAVMCQSSVFADTPGDRGLPFGNPNFNVGGAVPLLGLVAFYFHDRVSVGIFISGLLAAAILGTGLQFEDGRFFFGDPARSVWVGLTAMAAMAVILRLSARCHGWLISCGALSVTSAMVVLVLGVVSLPFHSPSIDYRLSLWICAGEAIAQDPLCGGGPGSPIISLQEQDSSPVAWLSVPSYAEHAHNEYLNVMLEGGGIGVIFLLSGLLATVIPLWRRRADPVCASMLVAWSGVLAHALIESHLSQPGPLLLLALLAGGTWAVTQETSPRRAGQWMEPAVGTLCALLVAVQIVRDFTTGGTPSMIERRATVQMAALEKDWLAVAGVAAQVRQRLGNLDNWLVREAEARAHGRDFSQAETLALQQVARQPLDANAIDILLRLRDRYRKKWHIDDANRLDAVLRITEVRAKRLLEEVPDNPLSHVLRDRLVVFLETISK